MSSQFIWNIQDSLKGLTYITKDISTADIQETAKSVYPTAPLAFTLFFGSKASLGLRVLYSCQQLRLFHSSRMEEYYNGCLPASIAFSEASRNKVEKIACGDPFKSCELHLTPLRASQNCSSMKNIRGENKNEFMDTHIFAYQTACNFQTLQPHPVILNNFISLLTLYRTIR